MNGIPMLGVPAAWMSGSQNGRFVVLGIAFALAVLKRDNWTFQIVLCSLDIPFQAQLCPTRRPSSSHSMHIAYRKLISLDMLSRIPMASLGEPSGEGPGSAGLQGYCKTAAKISP